VRTRLTIPVLFLFGRRKAASRALGFARRRRRISQRTRHFSFRVQACVLCLSTFCRYAAVADWRVRGRFAMRLTACLQTRIRCRGWRTHSGRRRFAAAPLLHCLFSPALFAGDCAANARASSTIFARRSALHVATCAAQRVATHLRRSGHRSRGRGGETAAWQLPVAAVMAGDAAAAAGTFRSGGRMVAAGDGRGGGTPDAARRKAALHVPPRM